MYGLPSPTDGSPWIHSSTSTMGARSPTSRSDWAWTEETMEKANAIPAIVAARMEWFLGVGR